MTIKDVDRGTEYHTATKEQGGYEQGQLLAGPYTVEITAPGFTTFSSSVQVHVDSTVKLDASLKVGSGSGTVQVTDETPLLQVDRAEISTQLTTSEVEDCRCSGAMQPDWRLRRRAQFWQTSRSPTRKTRREATSLPPTDSSISPTDSYSTAQRTTAPSSASR